MRYKQLEVATKEEGGMGKVVKREGGGELREGNGRMDG